MQVSILKAQNSLSQLNKSTQAGDEVIIANRGAPVARLVAVEPVKSTSSDRNFLAWLKKNPLPAYAQRSSDEIGVSIEEERNAWN